ncbi:MAG: hypothetical protein V4443_10780 [Pseudomonadota bacterium]
MAGSADYVYTPTVEAGEREFDVKYGSAKQADGTEEQVISAGGGYGVSEFWFTEVYLKREIAQGISNLTIGEWENKFQLTETGKYAVDVGLLTEFEAPLSDSNEPYEFKFGALLQREYGKVQLNGNLLFERKFGHGAGAPTEIGYQWQAKYRWQPTLEFGAQGIGELGKWDEWEHDDQAHRMGPAVFGKVALGNHQYIKYNSALLFGVSTGAPAHTFRFQAEYEF